MTGTANGSFKGGNYVGTLANGGVALAPFHDFDSKVPAALKTELAQLKAGIVDGSIKTADQEPGVAPAATRRMWQRCGRTAHRCHATSLALRRSELRDRTWNSS